MRPYLQNLTRKDKELESGRDRIFYLQGDWGMVPLVHEKDGMGRASYSNDSDRDGPYAAGTLKRFHLPQRLKGQGLITPAD